MTPPAIGSPWHDQYGRNLFVTDIVWRTERVVVKFTTEMGFNRESPLPEFLQLFTKGYAL